MLSPPYFDSVSLALGCVPSSKPRLHSAKRLFDVLQSE